MQFVCPRDSATLVRSGLSDKLDGGQTIELYHCPRCGHKEWVRPKLAHEVCDQTRYSGVKGRRVA